MTISGIIEEKVEIPKGVTVQIDGAAVTVKGKVGELKRSFVHPKVKIGVKEGNVVVSAQYPRVKDKATVGTFASHIQNMIDGVQGGFEYHMKIVYSHFPMKATVKGDKFVIENFLGEKAPRHADILRQTKVTVKGNEVVLHSIELEAVSQSAANIERACKIRGFDPRVFQDGIYIVEKARKVKA
ncbi:MAG: 50S ribosomal protein L6 [Methanomassiliicoccales archaeon]|nr:50S ribosomal protein L6 [Methanomassiliicoccales archaeon]